MVFKEGEKVLCFHGPLIYEAKCLKAKEGDKFLIHYQGWNKSWDEWVPIERILKYNEENLKKQKELKENQDKSKKRRKEDKKKEKEKEKDVVPVGKNKNSVNSNEEKVKEVQKKKQKVEAFVESEESFNTKMEIKIKIPDELKPWLVDDWDLITRQKKLIQLPARVTVDHILDDYVKQKTINSKLSQSKESAINEFVSGIKDYFNAMIGSQLLYRFERLQYQSQLKEAEKMSSIYGGIHLLRLFVKLGNMLVYTHLDEKNIQILLVHMHDFLKYLARNSSYFSLNDYIVASPEYYRNTI